MRKRKGLNDKAVGERVRIIRKNLPGKISQTKLGDLLGVSREEVSRIELGKVSLAAEYAEKLSSLANARKEWLYYGSGPMLKKDEAAAIDEGFYNFCVLSSETRKKRVSTFSDVLERSGYIVKKEGEDVSIRPGDGARLTPEDIAPLVFSASAFQDLADRFAFQSEALEKALAEAILLGAELTTNGEPARYIARAGKLVGRDLIHYPLLNPASKDK